VGGARARAQPLAPTVIAPAGAAPALAAGACCAPAPLDVAIDTLPGVARAGGNPAGLARALGGDRARLAAGVDRVAGALRRPQQPARTHAAAGAAEGVRRFGRGGAAVATGSFAAARRADAEVAWTNAGDAYARTPYVWADSIGGDWQHDVVALGAALAGPLSRLPPLARAHGGLAVDYAVSQGARQNDPRPLARRRWLALTPGLVVVLGAGVRAGVRGTVAWEREDQELGGGPSPDNPTVFRLRGPATFDRTQLNSAERVVHGRRVGGGVQLVGGPAEGSADRGAEGTAARSAWHWGAAADAFVQTDSVRDGVATPTPGGFSRRVHAGGRGALRRSAPGGGLELAVHAARETVRGTDQVFGAVNAVDEAWTAGAALALWRGGPPGILPGTPDRARATRTLTAGIDVRRLARRDVVGEARWAATAPELSLAAAVRRPVPGGTLLLGASARAAVGAAWAYDAAPGRLVGVLLRPDFLANAAPRAGAGALVAYERAVGAALHRVVLDAARSAATGPADGVRPAGHRARLSLAYELRT